MDETCVVCGREAGEQAWVESHMRPDPGPRVWFCDDHMAKGVMLTPNTRATLMLDVRCGNLLVAVI